MLLLSAIVTCPLLLSWGIYGHEHINHAAVMALPESSLRQFFYNHIDFITQESTVPDVRKYTMNDKTERPRHYIDYENFTKCPLPHRMDELHKIYPDSFLQKNGYLPWHIQDMMEKLTVAFKNRRKTEILFLAGDLGHYIGDAHMPLHVSNNHDGQLTNQRGIHAFWETQLPEMFGDSYDYHTEEGAYISDVTAEVFRLMEETHCIVDTLLRVERELSAKAGGKGIFEEDKDGKLTKNKYGDAVHTSAYAAQYHAALHGMVERQMRRAIHSLSSFWYTAWVNAGKPDLNDFDPHEVTANNRKAFKRELKLWRGGKLYGLESEREFVR